VAAAPCRAPSSQEGREGCTANTQAGEIAADQGTSA
jgi:hypothetical protein